mgnify:CR=1 FL=1
MHTLSMSQALLLRLRSSGIGLSGCPFAPVQLAQGKTRLPSSSPGGERLRPGETHSLGSTTLPRLHKCPDEPTTSKHWKGAP